MPWRETSGRRTGIAPVSIFEKLACVFNGLGVGPSLALTPDGMGGYFIRFAGHAGLAYELQRAAMVIGPWPAVATNAAPASGLMEFHDTNAPLDAAFYRAVPP